MILKDLLTSPKLLSKIRKFRSGEIFDIVVYGSLVKGKEKINDLDMGVILRDQKNLNKKLEYAEEFKRQLDFLNCEVDVKVIDLTDFMDVGFIARQAILAEGFSLIHKKYLHELFGFSISVLFEYSLSNLSYSQKKMLYYALKGRRGQKGLLKIRKGVQISRCVIEVPLEHTEEFKTLFQRYGIKYKIKNVLRYIM